VRHRELSPDMVTQPTTNQARHRLTSLIETNALLLCQTALHREIDIQTDITVNIAGNNNIYMSTAWENICLKAFDRDEWGEWSAGCASHWMDRSSALEALCLCAI